MKLTPLPFLLFFAAASTVSAAATHSPDSKRLADLRNAKAAVEQAKAESPLNKEKITALIDHYGYTQSLVGDSAGALASLDESHNAASPNPGTSSVQLGKFGEASAEDAIQAIVSAARNKRVVFINESHHVPMHRAFAQKLAEELHKIGFNYLACETFNPQLNEQPKFVAFRLGAYTQEPVFAGFVNSAVAAGWTLVPYEWDWQEREKTPPADRMRVRDETGAKNIYDRIFAKDPNARALIYVGYHHLSKSRLNSLPRVGSELREKLGEAATLHVDQTPFYAHPDRVGEDALYRPLIAKFASDKPIVLRGKDGKMAVMEGLESVVDMQVIFPDYGLENGRPQWLSTLAGRKPQAIPAELLPQQGQRLILAYGKQHGPDAVPIDAVLVEAGKPAPALMLPEGEVRLRTED